MMAIPDTQNEYAPVALVADVPVNDTLGEPLCVATAVDTRSPEAQPFLEVVAPATLPEGYTFEAEASGHRFTVKVPVGGVEEGQKFSVPFLAGSNGNSGAAIPRASIPEGRWRDDCCDCFRHGVCHPMLWNAGCCPLILVGQTMQRLNLTWLGNEVGTSLDPSVVVGRVGTFRIMLWITVVYYIASVFLYFLVPVRYLLALSFGLFSIVLVCKTRKRIREKYRIPEKQCHGCEDCCCAYWCGCCTVAQMARHTADYETYPGLCCSETGVSPHAPSIV